MAPLAPALYYAEPPSPLWSLSLTSALEASAALRRLTRFDTVRQHESNGRRLLALLAATFEGQTHGSGASSVGLERKRGIDKLANDRACFGEANAVQE